MYFSFPTFTFPLLSVGLFFDAYQGKWSSRFGSGVTPLALAKELLRRPTRSKSRQYPVTISENAKQNQVFLYNVTLDFDEESFETVYFEFDPTFI